MHVQMRACAACGHMDWAGKHALDVLPQLQLVLPTGTALGY